MSRLRGSRAPLQAPRHVLLSLRATLDVRLRETVVPVSRRLADTQAVIPSLTTARTGSVA